MTLLSWLAFFQGCVVCTALPLHCSVLLTTSPAPCFPPSAAKFCRTSSYTLPCTVIDRQKKSLFKTCGWQPLKITINKSLLNGKCCNYVQQTTNKVRRHRGSQHGVWCWKGPFCFVSICCHAHLLCAYSPHLHATVLLLQVTCLKC